MLSDRKTIKNIVENLKKLHNILATKAHRVLIHCAAGIHRTGTLTYSLLRLDGLERQPAYEALKIMRKATYEGVGDWRIELAEKMIIPGVFKMLEDR